MQHIVQVQIIVHQSKVALLACNFAIEGWNRVRLSSNNGVLDTKLYHKAIGEVSAGSHSNSISYSLKYKLGSTFASSNSYILHSFTFTDDDSLSTVATTALYPNSKYFIASL